MERFKDDSIFPLDTESRLPIHDSRDSNKLIREQWELAPFWNNQRHFDPPPNIPIEKSFVEVENVGPDEEADSGSFGIISECTIRKGHLLTYPEDQVRIFRTSAYCN